MKTYNFLQEHFFFTLVNHPQSFETNYNLSSALPRELQEGRKEGNRFYSLMEDGTLYCDIWRFGKFRTFGMPAGWLEDYVAKRMNNPVFVGNLTYNQVSWAGEWTEFIETHPFSYFNYLKNDHAKRCVETFMYFLGKWGVDGQTALKYCKMLLASRVAWRWECLEIKAMLLAQHSGKYEIFKAAGECHSHAKFDKIIGAIDAWGENHNNIKTLKEFNEDDFVKLSNKTLPRKTAYCEFVAELLKLPTSGNDWVLVSE